MHFNTPLSPPSASPSLFDRSQQPKEVVSVAKLPFYLALPDQLRVKKPVSAFKTLDLEFATPRCVLGAELEREGRQIGRQAGRAE